MEGHGAVEEAYGKIGVSRATLFNWFQRETAPPGREKLDKLRRYLDGDADWVLYGRTAEPKRDHLKSGGRGSPMLEEPRANYGQVAPRIPIDKRMPTRSDCEALLQQLLDAAEAEGSPENIPVIYHRLKKQFPLDEWAQEPDKT